MDKIKTLAELEIEISILVSKLQLRTKRINLTKNTSFQFIAEDFGVVVCGMNHVDYVTVKTLVEDHLKDYKVVYVSVVDNISEKRYELIWELMTVGYMRWIRYENSHRFTNLITMENFGRKIIDERLRRFNKRPMYKYLIEQNEWAKRNAASYVLAVDPGFFDMMPEITK